MWDYTDKVREHFLAPRNVGAIENADGVGEVGSIACGDALKLFLKVDENERIVEVKFQTFGCASAIASSSALTEMVKGKTLDEALTISNQDIADYLGGLPKEKMHCSVMGREALEAAVRNLRGEAAPEIEGEIVCECFGVTDVQIKRAVHENHLTTLEDVTAFTKAGGGCAKCHERIQGILDQELGVAAPAPASAAADAPAPKPRLTNMQRMALIEKVIEEDVRPMLAADGGDIELVDIDRTTVFVKLRGRCTSCPSSGITLRHGVEATLRDKVDPDIQVKEG